MRMIKIIITQSVFCQMQHNTCQGILSSASSVAPTLITARRLSDKRAVEMVAFNFAGRSFTYKRIAQGLSRSVSALSCFMRKCLEPVIKADQSAQHVDVYGIAHNNPTKFTRNFQAAFQCIHHAELNLTTKKCLFGVRQIDCRCRSISSFCSKSRSARNTS